MKKLTQSKVFKSILFIVVCLIIGFMIGYISSKYSTEYMDSNIVGDNLFNKLTRMYGTLVLFLAGFLMHIIIHEAGHLIFGLITGYSYVSFRIGSYTLVKHDKKLKIKRFNIPGTAGQCLMMPPKIIDGKFPFVIYNFGGAIMNIIVSITTIAIPVLVKGLPFYLNVFLFSSGVAGIFLGLTNAIPLKIGGIANDGYNVLSMYRDEEARMGFHLQLKVNGLLSQGTRLKDMPLDYFKLEDGADLSNPLNTSTGLIRYYWYLDNLDLEMARKCIESFIPYLETMIPLYKFEINCERIFMELIGDCNKSIIDNLYDKSLNKYMKAAKYMIGKKRVWMTYEAYYNRDINMALKQYENIKDLASKYAIKGEADMELMISDWVIEKMQIGTIN